MSYWRCESGCYLPGENYQNSQASIGLVFINTETRSKSGFMLIKLYWFL